MQVSVLASTNPLVRSLVNVTVAADVAILYMEFGSDSVKLTVREHLDDVLVEQVPLEHVCLSCSIREALIPMLEELSFEYRQLIVSLPVAVELINVVPTLENALADSERPIVLSRAVCALGLNELSAGLLTHKPLCEVEAELFPGDDRCLGEVLLTNVCYADAVITVGTDRMSSDLLEHLRYPETVRIDHLEALEAKHFFSGRHDSDVAIARVHPVTTTAWGGPNASGVWTLDLHSSRPFHPGRLRERIADLAPAGTCVRGCFWLPARTDEVCAIDSAGGQVSIGSAGPWFEDRFTHLIVVGVGDGSLKEQIRNTFEECLLRPEDQLSVDISGTTDSLPDWFGELD